MENRNILKINYPTLNVIFKIPKEESIEKTDSFYYGFHQNVFLKDVIKNYILNNKVKRNKNYYFYLLKNNQIEKELPQDIIVYKLNLKNYDEILISYNKINQTLNMNSNNSSKKDIDKKTIISSISKNPILSTDRIAITNNLNKINNLQEEIHNQNISKKNNYNIKKKINLNNEKNFDINNDIKLKMEKTNIMKSKNYFKIIIFLFILSIVLVFFIILSIFLIWFFHLKKNKNNYKAFKKQYHKQNLVISKNYPTNMLLRFSSIKDNKMEITENEEKKNNSIESFWQTTDFFFIVRESKIERNEEDLTESELYTGYIGFLNLTLHNKTNDMIFIYDETLNEILGEKNLRNLEKQDLQYIGGKGNFCFVKIEFYQNGNIKNYYLPNGFLYDFFIFIEDIVKLSIPKISSNLYVKNINDSLNEIISNNNNYTNESLENIDSNLTYNDSDFNFSNFKSRRYLEKKRYKKYKINNVQFRDYNYSKKISKNRKLSEEDEKEDNITSINYSGDVDIEEYYIIPSTPSMNIDLREANTNDNCSNLTQFSASTAENKEAKLEGSKINSTIYSKINNEGILEYVEELQISSFESNSLENDEDDETTNNFLNENYNDKNNQISLKEYKEMNNNEKNNSLKIPLINIMSISSHKINILDYFINETINNKLYKYFDNFTYEMYVNETDNEEKEKESNSDIINEEENSNRRRLDEAKTYYGKKKVIHAKQLYKYNIIGIRLEKQSITEIDPSTGIVSTYFKKIFGNKEVIIRISDQYTNMHIITERSNQMGYNLISLLHQTNINIQKKNEMNLNKIREIENNITEKFYDYDYSNIFKNSLDDMYQQVKNFSGNFFIELISIINVVYDNFTILLKDVIEEKYDITNQIRNITKFEYINYIYEMLNCIENFKNATMEFFDNVLQELNKINDFQIDFLYDIIDKIYEGKIIFSKFNKNLFNSIEKGILQFKYELRDYIEETIGDLLYLTDFLYININKNDILKKAIDEGSRKDVTFKLKNFRDIVLYIMDLITKNIYQDYDENMNLNNDNSLKLYSYNKVNLFLNETGEKSKETIENIKSKINNIHLYELFTGNVDIINDINNKTIVENINNIYNNIIYNLTRIKPEYLDEKSDLEKNKNLLFNFSKTLTETINEEIKDINEYISNYSISFINENIYNIYYNLYYIKNFFKEEEINNLLNQFYLLVNITIKSHLKQIIEKNFNISYNIILYAINYGIKNGLFWRISLCSGFIERYNNFKSKFENFIDLINSEELLLLYEKYFYKLRDDILNYVKNKLLSINEFFFSSEIYYKNFYFIKQTKNEILKIIDNINNYFSEINLNNDLKLNTFNLFQEELLPFHRSHMDNLEKLYNYLDEKYIQNKRIKDCKEDFYTSCLLWECKKKYFSRYLNIDSIIDNLESTDKFLNNQINKIFYNFIYKFDKYLNNYINYCQNLYNNLNKYVENKINNFENIEILMNEYKSIFSDIINNNSNKGLFKRLIKFQNNIGQNINVYLKNLESNINLIKDNYFNNYYLKDYNQFLEYPEEIIYKINQFLDELIDNSDKIKDLVNLIFKKRINNIIFSTNTYISNFIEFHFKYIITNINSQYIIREYYFNKYKKIKLSFEECLNKFNNISKEKFIDDENNNFLNLENYKLKIENIFNNYSNFICFFQNFTNNTFLSEKNFSQNYSEYDYNIVKLRTGIFYTKNLLENYEIFLEEINFKKIINIDEINKYDEIVNDNNILNIYNETNYKLKIINNESLSFIEESFQNFIADFKTKYSYENDYLPFIQKFKKIISFENNDFNNNITFKKNDTMDNIIKLLYEFNDTLFEQISILKNNSNYIYEIDLKEAYLHYYSLILKAFNDTKNIIISLNHSYLFHNSINNIINNLQYNKRAYFKEIVNIFSKKYDFSLINISYDLGENLKIFMEREFNDYEFAYIYDYVEIFENSTSSFINKILFNLNNLEINTIYIYNNIFDELNSIYRVNNSNSTDNKNTELENNNTIYLNDFNNKYKNKLDNIINNLISKIKNNIIDDHFIVEFLEKENYKLDSYENITLSDMSNNFENIESIIYYLNNIKTDEYKNYLYNLLITSFNSSYTNLINNFITNELIDNINIIINNKLELYIEHMTKKLKNEYNYYLFLLNNTKDLGYSSKMAFINLYIKLKEAINETIYYNIEYEINYYLDLFYKENKNLFLNNYLNYYINNLNKYDIKVFNLNQFLNEIIYDKKFNLTIKDISNKLINNDIFKIIKNEINSTLIVKLQKIYDLCDDFEINIKSILDNKIIKDFPEDMYNLNELINNYIQIIDNQKNHYIFKIGKNPYILINNFINNNLSPPLNRIKTKYNIIEETLLNEIEKIVKTFPDFYSIIKDKLNLELIYEIILLYNEDLYLIFEEYKDYINTDLDSYMNKLVHYTYIDGFNYYKDPCNSSECFIDLTYNDTNNNTIRRLNSKEKNNSFIFYKDKTKNTKKIKKLMNKKIRKLNGYDSTMGAITKDDILYYLLELKYTLYNFNESYLDDCKNFQNKVRNYLLKIKNVYLQKLKIKIDMTSKKFVSILTLDNYKQLEKIIYMQYNNISLYINNNSEMIELSENKFFGILNYSSFIIGLIYNISYTKINELYEIYYNLIQEKIKYLSKEEINKNKLRLLSIKKTEKIDDENEQEDIVQPNKKYKDPFIFEVQRIKTKEKMSKFGKFRDATSQSFKKLFSNLIKNIQISSHFSDFELNIESIGVTESFFFTNIKSTSIQIAGYCFNALNINKNFTFPISLIKNCLDLGFSVMISFDLSVCVEIGMDFNFVKNDKNDTFGFSKEEGYGLSFYINGYGKATVGVGLDLGFYIPRCPRSLDGKNGVDFILYFSVNIGLRGTLVSAKAGCKLYFYSNYFTRDLYIELRAIEFYFYIMFKFVISIKFKWFGYSFSYYFYLFNYKLCGWKSDYHWKRYYKYEGAKELGDKAKLYNDKGWKGNVIRSYYN